MNPDTRAIWTLTKVGPLGRRWRLALALYVGGLRGAALWLADR